MRKLVVVFAFLTAFGIRAQQSDLSVTKTASPALPAAGDELLYTIVFRNDGPDSAQQVLVEDLTPANTTFVSVNDFLSPGLYCVPPPFSGVAGIRCHMTTLPAGQQRTATMRVRINQNAVGATISNTVTITSNTADPDTTDNSLTLLTPVSPIPPSLADLSIHKRTPDLSDPYIGRGEVATFEITITNSGPIPAQNVTLTDIVPAQTTFESIAPPAGFICSTPAQGATGTVTCTAAAMPDHTSATFTLNVRLGNSASGVITNTATVSSSTTDPDTNDLSSSATVIATDPGADLRIGKTAVPATVAAGETITYTIQVDNIGSQGAGNVKIVDFVPANTTFVGASAGSGTGSGLCAPTSVTPSGAMECYLNTIGAQQGRTVSMTVRVNPDAAGATITNTATVSSDTPDPNSSNNTATVQTPVSPVAPTTAEISVTKQSDGFVGRSEVEIFTIEVRNLGPLAAQNLALTDVIPSQMTFESIAAPAGFTCSTPAQGANGTITCSNPSFADQAVATFTLSLRANNSAAPGTTFSNTATVSSSTPDPDTANNSSSRMVTITESTGADLRLTKTSDPASVNRGQIITYNVTATNIGSEGASFVSITDPIPAGTTFVSVVEPPGTGFNCFEPHFANQFVMCTIPGLGPTGSFTMTFSVRVNDDAAGPIANTATVSSNTTDPVPANNTSSVLTAVSGPAVAAAIPLLDMRALVLLALMLTILGFYRSS